MKKFFQNKKGFTIIETMIAVAIFTVIIMIGVGALLNANDVHKKTAKIRTVMDNLSFVMEDMARNLRTGTEYECTGLISTSFPNCLSGEEGKQIKFINNNVIVNPPEHWTYAFVQSNTPGFGDLQKTIDTGSPMQLNPEEVKFDSNSGFIVTGANLAGADNEQPYVIIKFSGTIFYKGAPVTNFSLETSASQRASDI